MLINRDLLRPGLLRNSPFVRYEAVALVPDKAFVFKLTLPQYPLSPIQVNLDGWENQDPCIYPFIRVGAQAGLKGPGCFYSCSSCIAAMFPGKNLKPKEIVYQALFPLLSGHVNLSSLNDVVVASMSTGEPFVNLGMIAAYEELHRIVPDARFMLSTTGPKSGLAVFNAAVRLVKERKMFLGLQLSINTLRPQVRLDYIGDPLGQLSWTLEDLSDLAAQWRRETGTSVHLNFVVGPDLPLWELFDYAELFRLFPPSLCIIKLSLEGVYNHKTWDMNPYHQEIRARESRLSILGYQCYRFFLEDVQVPGVSCGSQALPGAKLVQLQQPSMSA